MSEQLLQKAQEFQKKGQIGDAIEIYQELISESPLSVQPYRHLGDILFKRKELESAAQSYQKVVELDPTVPHAHFRLGQICKARKQWADAIDYFQKAIALNPKNPWFRKLLGEIYLAQDLSDKAEQALQQAIELKSDLADAYFRLGIAQQKQRKFDQAIASFESLLDLNPMHIGAYQRTGDIYIHQKKNNGKAIAHYQKALAIKSDNPFLYAKLARALHRNGQGEQAMEAWGTAIQLKPDRHGFHEQLGDVLLQEKDWEGAIASYEKAIALKPELPSLREKLNRALQQQTVDSKSVAALGADAPSSPESALVETGSEETRPSESEVDTISSFSPPQSNESIAESKLGEMPQLGEIPKTLASDSNEQPRSEINQSAAENVDPIQTISKAGADSLIALQEQLRELPQNQSLKEVSTSSSLEKRSRKMPEPEVFRSNSRVAEENSLDLQEVPITVNLNETVKHSKGGGKSGKAPFSKHKRRMVRSATLDNTGFQKDFSFSAEGVGGYDEGIPNPVKKILLFLLLGFYGTIALTLFLKGLTVLGIFMVAVAVLILLIFLGFRKLQQL